MLNASYVILIVHTPPHSFHQVLIEISKEFIDRFLVCKNVQPSKIGIFCLCTELCIEHQLIQPMYPIKQIDILEGNLIGV